MQSNYLPPLEPIGDFRSYVCGDVVIDQTAAIASGVLIQADQGGQIIIAAGVCIGMGAVLHAQGGLLEIGAGANLGAGVLVYGTSKIGEGACIGASSSIVRAVIAKGAIVPPCSLVSGLEQGSVEKEASPAIAQELETKNTFVSPQVSSTNYAFTHTYSSASSANPLNPPLSNSDINENMGGRSTAESQVTETQVEIPPNSIAEPPLEFGEAEQQSGVDILENTDSNPMMGSDISAMTSANSAQAKAYAQSQINRYIKRLFPQN